MEIVMIFNGLGNQMSQYAFFLAKKKISNNISYAYNLLSSEHNGCELNSVFDIKYPSYFANIYGNLLYRIFFAQRYLFVVQWVRKLLNMIGVCLIKESSNYDFDNTILMKNSGCNLYYGGWHSEKYFLSESEIIRSVFKFNEERLNESSKKYLNQILKIENAVSIHIRRGDYLNPEHYLTFGCVCDLEYYQKAIAYMQKKFSKPYFFVFSNDMKWVRENLLLEDVQYVDCNNGVDSWMDMCLMSHCKHNIISNSTFSWWGAWLNNSNSKIVVAPKEFIHNIITKDFYPDSWIKI